MPPRKNPTYTKKFVAPRKPGEKLLRTTVWLTETHREWLKTNFPHGSARPGASLGIRRLIQRAIDEDAEEKARLARTLKGETD